jgi:hypothetical protein
VALGQGAIERRKPRLDENLPTVLVGGGDKGVQRSAGGGKRGYGGGRREVGYYAVQEVIRKGLEGVRFAGFGFGVYGIVVCGFLCHGNLGKEKGRGTGWALPQDLR